MFENWWKDKQSAMRRYFPEEPENVTNAWMEFGSRCAAALEQKPLPDWVAHLAIPQYNIQEYRIIEDIEGYMIRGTLDRYSTELHKILDDKCTKTIWSKNKAQGHVQLDFYSVLVEHRHGWVDNESHIHCIPIDMDENSFIRFTGAPTVLLPHITTQEMRNELKSKIISTAKDIQVCWEAYQRGDIKL
jgi:hypothetical protein